MNDIEVTQESEHKHQGLILDSKLSFASHINEKITTARKGLGIIKHLPPYLPVSTLNQIYKMYVRPHLDFCDVFIHVPKQLNEFDSSIRLNNFMASIERIQYEAERI